MHTAVNASVANLIECLRKALIGTHRLCETGNVAIYREAEVVCAKKEFQGLRCGSAEASMRCGILWMVRRHYLDDPVDVSFGLGVAIGVAGANRGDRSPKVVSVLRVPARDYGVRGSCCQHSEETCVLFE